MALLFLLREKLLQREALPLLSASDVKVLLARLRPRSDASPKEVIRKFSSDINSAKRPLTPLVDDRRLEPSPRRGI